MTQAKTSRSGHPPDHPLACKAALSGRILLAYRELDAALGLTTMAVSTLAEGRRGPNIRHRLLGLLGQAVQDRLASHENVNDAEPLAHDRVTHGIVSREDSDRPAASTSAKGRFEAEWLATEANLDPTRTTS
jgi:hypothetical protein